jgi:excinuclease ABC subunit B
MGFTLASLYAPAGDQPGAISGLVEGVRAGHRYQTLLGVTGSGKTFTAANVIAQIGKPALVIAHNKTLAAQLAQEYRQFFPDHAVCYFVSYYDYYQPEAYKPSTDTYIEKEAQINAEIDRLRHATTQALLTRSDVIVVASVSCIYGLGSPEEYEKVHLKVVVGQPSDRASFMRALVGLYFTRTTADLTPGTFRARGNMVEVMPTNERVIYRVDFTSDTVSGITIIDAISRGITSTPSTFFIFPAKHYVTAPEDRARALADIEIELSTRLAELAAEGKVLEHERLKRRTKHDIAMIREVGYTNGIENYSRHFDGRKPGEPPYTLLSYFPHTPEGKPDFLTIIDESHVTIPQLGGMYAGDQSRKSVLIEHGFRLPSAKDNRPLQFHEVEERLGQVICTSATPGPFEREHSAQIVEQIIRPTGLLDPIIEVRPILPKGNYTGQVTDFIEETAKTVEHGGRVLTTTLTKKMAEDFADFLRNKKIKAEYLHSDIKTLERIEILTKFRKGEFDVLVGVNLLREGLDLPEVELVGILDADKEGFLRSETSLIQTMGRAARNINGKVILYADEVTKSMDAAISETRRRREIQSQYNSEHNITPATIHKAIHDITDQIRTEHQKAVDLLMSVDADLYAADPKALIAEKKKQMAEAVQILDFETAAILRDELFALEQKGSTKKPPRAKQKRRS